MNTIRMELLALANGQFALKSSSLLSALFRIFFMLLVNERIALRKPSVD